LRESQRVFGGLVIKGTDGRGVNGGAPDQKTSIRKKEKWGERVKKGDQVRRGGPQGGTQKGGQGAPGRYQKETQRGPESNVRGRAKEHSGLTCKSIQKKRWLTRKGTQSPEASAVRDLKRKKGRPTAQGVNELKGGSSPKQKEMVTANKSKV